MQFVKDIYYPPFNSLTPYACNRVMEAASVDAGSYVRMATILLQVKEGAQLWVSKEVSADLLLSEIEPDEIKFEDVVWPHDRLEVFFEDPSIPTFQAARFSNASQRAAMQRLLGEDVDLGLGLQADDKLGLDDILIHVQAMDTQDSIASLTYRPEDADSFAAGRVMPDASGDHHGWSVPMDHSEEAELRRLTVMFFKVLLFANSEGHTVRRTKDTPTRKQGGKAGFKNRPKTDRLIVEYLPRHRQDKHIQKVATDVDADRRKRVFLGRRGHWRRYKSAFYKKAQGKRVFIYPQYGPDGSPPPRRQFKVTRPEGAITTELAS